MGTEIGRDLTNQEYLVLGLISVASQSGYTIINYFEDWVYRWSSSPGTIYPMLKRLEKLKIIAGELEMVHETRPRKIYTLTPLGEQLLDNWLREPPDMPPLYERREMALMKFLFMEGGLTPDEIIRWLDNYQAQLDLYDYGRRVFSEATIAAMDEYNLPSMHRQLVLEATVMEVNTLRTWIQMARARIEAAARRTGEQRTVDLE